MKRRLIFSLLILSISPILLAADLKDVVINVNNPNSDIRTIQGLKLTDKYEAKKHSGETVIVDLLASDTGVIIVRDGKISKGTNQPVQYTIYFKEGEDVAPGFKAPKGGVNVTFKATMVEGGKLTGVHYEKPADK